LREKKVCWEEGGVWGGGGGGGGGEWGEAPQPSEKENRTGENDGGGRGDWHPMKGKIGGGGKQIQRLNTRARDQ